MPLRLVFFVDAFRTAAFGAGVDTAEVEDSTAGVLMGACIELGDAELGTGYPAVGGDGFACTAKPLLVPPDDQRHCDREHHRCAEDYRARTQ